MENKLKTLETSPKFVDNSEYTKTNEKLYKICQEKTNGIRMGSKCDWYESRAIQNGIRNILIGNIEINKQKDINNELYSYYKSLFNERQHLSEYDINNFLNAVSKFPQLSTEQSLKCEKFIREK